MHDNIDQLKDLEVDMYTISSDKPEEQLELYTGLKDHFGFSLPFISDPDFEIIERFDMKNGDVAYRGYGILDTEGNPVFHTINDHWGDELDQTVTEIKEQFDSLTNK